MTRHFIILFIYYKQNFKTFTLNRRPSQASKKIPKVVNNWNCKWNFFFVYGFMVKNQKFYQFFDHLWIMVSFGF